MSLSNRHLNLATVANAVTGGNGDDVLFTATNGDGADVLESDAGSITPGLVMTLSASMR